jgi:hypothetical protein
MANLIRTWTNEIGPLSSNEVYITLMRISTGPTGFAMMAGTGRAVLPATPVDFCTGVTQSHNLEIIHAIMVILGLLPRPRYGPRSVGHDI